MKDNDKRIHWVLQIVFTIIIGFSNLFANEFIIESFKALPNDMGGSVYAKKDGNNEFCGLIKVKTGIREELAFDSGLKFSPSEKKNPGEYWIYVSPGEGRITLMAEGFVPKHYQITTEKIESKQTYELIVREKEENKIPISIIAEPGNAEKWLDEDSLGTNDNFKVKPGNYKLTIKKEGYKDYENDIIINEDNTLIKNIKLALLEPVKLEIFSFPEGADIYINNTNTGKITNNEIFLFPNEYKIRISKPGYLEAEKEVNLRSENKYHIDFTLVKDRGNLLLSILPNNAEVYINKENYTGQNNIELAPGVYQIEIKKEGYFNRTEVVNIKRGTTYELPIKLEPETGRLQFSVKPIQSQNKLIQNGNIIKSWEGLNYIKDIPVGPYKIESDAIGYSKEIMEFNINYNQTINIEIELKEAKYGSLNLNSNPTDAKLSIDNIPKGKTPYYQSMIQIGEYKCKLEKEYYLPINETFNIIAGQENYIYYDMIKNDILISKEEDIIKNKIYKWGVFQKNTLYYGLGLLLGGVPVAFLIESIEGKGDYSYTLQTAITGVFVLSLYIPFSIGKNIAKSKLVKWKNKF